MLCPYCFGKGYTYTETLPPDDERLGYCVPYNIQVRCEECKGSGITYCCEGIACDIGPDKPTEMPSN